MEIPQFDPVLLSALALLSSQATERIKELVPMKLHKLTSFVISLAVAVLAAWLTPDGVIEFSVMGVVLLWGAMYSAYTITGLTDGTRRTIREFLALKADED